MYINLLLFWRCNVISKELLINERINDREVRLIGEDGSQYGIVSLERAIEAAAEKNLDLVKVAPRSVPPVCRLMDYGKYNSSLQKRKRSNEKTKR